MNEFLLVYDILFLLQFLSHFYVDIKNDKCNMSGELFDDKVWYYVM